MSLSNLVFATICVFIISAVLLLSTLACSTAPPSTASSSLQRPENECEIPPSPVRPTGGELTVSHQRLNGGEFRITLRNASKDDVFLTYDPSNQESSTYVPYIVYRRDQNGEFVQLPSTMDYAPSTKALAPDKEIRLRFFNEEPGEYRLQFHYLVDAKVASVLNSPNCLFKLSDSDRKRLRELKSNLLTETLSIPQRIP